MLLEKYRIALPIPRTIGTLTRHAANRRYYRHTYLPHRCWSSVVSGGPTLFRHWVNVSCLLESGHSAFSRQRADQASPVVHGPDRVTVHPSPPPGQSETKFLLFLGPPPISKVDAINKKLGWTTCFGPFSKWPPSKSGNHVLCHNLSSKAVRVTKLVSMHIFLCN